MHVHLVWLTATFLSFPLLTICDPLFIMSTSQILQVGTNQKVFVEVQDYEGSNTLNIQINILNFPDKQTQLFSTTTTLNKDNNYQANVDITIPFRREIYNLDSEEQRYVYLRATWDTKKLEKIVMVSFQPGYLFIQTDKTIYTPDTEVRYRIFALNSVMKPMDQFISVKVVTPDGIIVEQSKLLSVRNGVVTYEYRLGNPTKNGIWKIAANFMDNPYKTFTTNFEVKEYRLPSFEVNLTPDKPFFYADDETFSVKITAKYLFGENVEGSAFVVFGVLKGNEKANIPSSLDRVDIKRGKGEAKLTREQILQTFPYIDQLVGDTLYISVSVLTNTGSEMVEAERRGIHIVTSPYTIQFTRAPRYFKPGMPFHFKVYVTNPDGTPAQNINLLLSDKNRAGQTDSNGIVLFDVNTDPSSTELKITVQTNEDSLKGRVGSQAVNTFTAHAYTSTSQSKPNYLHIMLSSTVMNVGSQGTFTLNIQTPSEDKNREITYMILNKGQIVKTFKIQSVKYKVISENIYVTREMLPSFRLLAYYHVGNSEVVADSILVDVKDTCNEKVQVTINDPKLVYSPQDQINLKLSAPPSASVYLVAVDKGIYVLNNKTRFTQNKIWDFVDKHDIGCTAGSGKNAMGVFYDAGLLFLSDTAGGTPERIDEREINDLFDQTISRTFYAESWLWNKEEIRSSTSFSIMAETLPDSLTTWVITAVSVSKDEGICVANPQEVIVKKNFFIDLKLPYSAAVNEQIEIKAVIHNLNSKPIKKVYVELQESEEICSMASFKGRYRTMVSIDGKSSRAVPFVIVPIETGIHNIEVKVLDRNDQNVDGVEKALKVVIATNPAENSASCNKFDLDVKMTAARKVSYSGAVASYTITIETKFLHERRDATYTILDIGILAGFVVDRNDLEKLMGVDRYIEQYEIQSHLSDKSSVILYLKKVSHRVKEKIVFRVHMMMKVAVLQPARVSVYEYYNADNQCAKFYDLKMNGSSGSLYLACRKDVCSCGDENCPLMKEPEVPDEKLRIREACRNKDFIYKATLKLVTREGSSDIYTFTIVEVLKDGTDNIVQNEQREFYINIACKNKLSLKVGKDYLIMGPEPKEVQDSWYYMIRTSSWLEYWPTQQESQSDNDNHRNRYMGLSSLKNLLKEKGCST